VVPRPLISRSGEGEALRLPLRWIDLLHGRLPVDLAASGGVHAARDVLKLLMVGANVTMLPSELLHAVDQLRAIQRNLVDWMEEHEYESVTQMRGSMYPTRVVEPAAFERAHYLRTVGTFTLASPLANDTVS
jgi:dihydroorotate dehydrogenase (fumarate)